MIVKTRMKSLIPILTLFFLFSHVLRATDQRPDILIIGSDTILLKTFPLEELGFTMRPFHYYGNYDFPGEDCFRGYQAVWKVINNKLFLSEIFKVGEPHIKIDIVEYFQSNGYTPIVIDGQIFADWFTKDLISFPRDFDFFGCIWKSHIKKQKPSMRFEGGVMKLNRYKERSKRNETPNA